MLRISLLVLMLALLAGCGDAPDYLTIAMKDMRFRDAEVRVQAGQPVTLRVVNQDSYAHAFDIDALDIHFPLVARETVEITFTPEHPGRYDFYCGTPGHVMAEMVGVLVVDE
jgi:plastocyanin